LITSEVSVPTYSYACTECGNRFDAVQAFSDDSLTSCPKCSGRLRKLFGSVGVVFKGSGFYRTDSREAAKSTINGSSSSSSESTTSSSSDKSSDKSSSDKSSSDKPSSDKSSSSNGSSSTSSAPAAAASS
jgi:putative FmdB family regulatory protein